MNKSPSYKNFVKNIKFFSQYTFSSLFAVHPRNPDIYRGSIRPVERFFRIICIRFTTFMRRYKAKRASRRANISIECQVTKKSWKQIVRSNYLRPLFTRLQLDMKFTSSVDFANQHRPRFCETGTAGSSFNWSCFVPKIIVQANSRRTPIYSS